nr:MAG TPA: hypothetical protein [Caudoviricetes sp.]
MDEGSRRGKDLAKPRERSGPAVSGFGMITGLEGCYVRLAVEVVRVAVEDYMDLLRLHMNRARYSRWYYTKHRRELDRAKTFLQSKGQRSLGGESERRKRLRFLTAYTARERTAQTDTSALPESRFRKSIDSPICEKSARRISRSLPLSRSSERRIWRRGLQKFRIRQFA